MAGTNQQDPVITYAKHGIEVLSMIESTWPHIDRIISIVNANPRVFGNIIPGSNVLEGVADKLQEIVDDYKKGKQHGR